MPRDNMLKGIKDNIISGLRTFLNDLYIDFNFSIVSPLLVVYYSTVLRSKIREIYSKTEVTWFDLRTKTY